MALVTLSSGGGSHLLFLVTGHPSLVTLHHLHHPSCGILSGHIEADTVTINLRPESPADIEAIAALTETAFATMPYASGTEHLIVGALREAGALTISLVAEMDGQVVGHVAVSPVTLSNGSSGWFGLGPISVLPEHQRRGIGSALMREALRLLRERGAAGCVLLGNPAYYSRFGFKAEPNLVLPDVPPEYFQALSFQKAIPQASVAFHDAFNVQPDKRD